MTFCFAVTILIVYKFLSSEIIIDIFKTKTENSAPKQNGKKESPRANPDDEVGMSEGSIV
ncbi:hypothetical protein AUK04_04110 [Candidatus Roizmanbacteria bacterium CG2_30_33_16]|uniref:Uncharacterized protein n=1 Tax=Candidatus Roizmanbacteria bacterium CG2_30_33_16 TaxID=1805340 RepID=A0A1J5HE23_9BACT|nr:MAG: hypothetical protein AUK04_04110 [Candidatus Roizmanbacteria bacterium CG2_30_33_16]